MNPRSWFTSAVGRKNAEATTGTLLLLFLIEHMVGNLLLLLSSPEPYQWYTTTLGHSIIVRVLEVALFALFVGHIVIGYIIRRHHRRIMHQKSHLREPKSLFTRYVSYTGLAILIFMLVHLWRFFVPNRITMVDSIDLYAEANAAFSNVWYTLFYVASMAMLSFHLVHGIRNAVVSFKRIPKHWIPQLRRASVWIAVIVPAILAYTVVHVYVRSLLM
jgi:succinate dehydrogenase / fumarate reductase cytochrome b subunit